ncbi:MAG TPA: hypothetical protein VJL89_00285 [Thermodesulfovibrionia bacterium]|nr:hypothetical protein [Thermodesulfovibrionia bacterium]
MEPVTGQSVAICKVPAKILLEDIQTVTVKNKTGKDSVNFEQYNRQA